ncbi:GumC family protein [Aestuariivirga sp.]|uniref:GumC family protein n=1 Tax=Aestuariivirga sp. TaxID=2650926 RepID=UPI003BA9D87E
MNEIPHSDFGADRDHARRPQRAIQPVETGRETRPEIFQPEPQGYGPYGDEDAKTFDIFKYLRIATKYKWLILGIAGSVLAITAVSTFMMTPIYKATASIQIEREATKVLDKGDVDNEEAGGQDFYQTQYQLLSSRTLSERVAAALSLGNDPAFNTEVAPSLLTLIRSKLAGLIFSEDNAPAGEATSAEAQSATDALDLSAAARLRGGLQIEPVRGSRIVNVSFNHPDPNVAKRVANGYAEVFITDNLDRRFEATAYARKFLEERLAQLKAKLEESEKLLVKYADEKGILTVGEGKTVVDSDIEALNTKLTDARYEKIRLELIWQRVENADGMEIAEIRNNETVQENRKLRSELSAQYQQKLNIFKPSYPEMQQLRSQIAELDAQLAVSVRAVKADIKSSYEAARISAAMLEGELEKGKKTLVEQRNRSIQYNILQREVDTNRQLYDGLLQRYKEIGVAGGIGTNNVSFVDKADAPGFPSSPNVKRNLLLGTLAGLALGFMAAFGLDFLDETFKVPEDIEKETGLPVVGIVPLPKDGMSIDMALQDQRSAVSEAYRSLRTSLQFSTPQGLPSSILVTSSMPSEGKSTSAIGIADTLGKVGLKVLLIDADLRKSSLHKRLQLRNDRGLTNYLIGGIEAADTLQVTPMQNVFAITSGPLPPNPAELLSGTRMAELIRAAGDAYDIVIVDGPPIIGLADAPLLAGATQVTLLLIGANSTRKRALRVAVRRMQVVRANIIGTVLNKFDRREASYGYGYGYGYSDYEYYGYGQKQLPGRKA